MGFYEEQSIRYEGPLRLSSDYMESLLRDTRLSERASRDPDPITTRLSWAEEKNGLGGLY